VELSFQDSNPDPEALKLTKKGNFFYQLLYLYLKMLLFKNLLRAMSGSGSGTTLKSMWMRNMVKIAAILFFFRGEIRPIAARQSMHNKVSKAPREESVANIK
jgi:hypothetical protein